MCYFFVLSSHTFCSAAKTFFTATPLWQLGGITVGELRKTLTSQRPQLPPPLPEHTNTNKHYRGVGTEGMRQKRSRVLTSNGPKGTVLLTECCTLCPEACDLFL